MGSKTMAEKRMLNSRRSPPARILDDEIRRSNWFKPVSIISGEGCRMIFRDSKTMAISHKPITNNQRLAEYENGIPMVFKLLAIWTAERISSSEVISGTHLNGCRSLFDFMCRSPADQVPAVRRPRVDVRFSAGGWQPGSTAGR